MYSNSGGDDDGEDRVTLIHRYDFEWLLEAVVKVHMSNSSVVSSF